MSERFIYTVSEVDLDKAICMKHGKDLTNGKASMQTYFSKKVKDVWMEERKGGTEGGDRAWKR